MLLSRCMKVFFILFSVLLIPTLALDAIKFDSFSTKVMILSLPLFMIASLMGTFSWIYCLMLKYHRYEFNRNKKQMRTFFLVTLLGLAVNYFNLFANETNGQMQDYRVQ